MQFTVHQAARISGRYLGQQKLARRIRINAGRFAQVTQDRVEISVEARRLFGLRQAAEAKGSGDGQGAVAP